MKIIKEKTNLELSNEDYHADEGYSSSHLKYLKSHSPYNYKYIRPLTEELKEPEHFKIGNFVHTMVLEPHRVEECYWRMPMGMNRNSKVFKEKRDEMLELGKKDIKHEDWVYAKMMRKAFEGEPFAVELRDNAEIEHSVYWEDDETSLVLKVRSDMACRNERVVVDLKTTDDMDRFVDQVNNLHYDLQGAHYCEGMQSDIFFLIALEKKNRFRCQVFELTENKLIEGRQKFRDTLGVLNECVTTDTWPTETKGVIEI